MVGLEEAKRVLYKFNAREHKLTEDDIMEIAASMTSAGGKNDRRATPHRKAAIVTPKVGRRKRNKLSRQDILDRVTAAFKRKGRLTPGEINAIAGKPSTNIIQQLRNTGLQIDREPEVHGTHVVNYYKVTKW